MNLIEYAGAWLENYKLNIIKPTTYRNYEYAIELCKKVMPCEEIENITTLTVQRAFVKLYELGYAKNTITIVKRMLSQLAEQAVAEGKLGCNCVKKAAIPHLASEKHISGYSEGELAALIKAASVDVQGDPILFLIYTGLRRCELLELRWEDYNSRDSIIRITNSKTDNGIREVALSVNAERILRRQPVREHGYIFSTTKGAPLSITSLKKTCRRLRKATSNNRITLHRCRHTFCSMLSDKGVSPKIIAELAGHSNVAFTMQRYVHPSRELKRQAVLLLDN